MPSAFPVVVYGAQPGNLHIMAEPRPEALTGCTQSSVVVGFSFQPLPLSERREPGP
jgi:hypothetical protein